MKLTIFTITCECSDNNCNIFRTNSQISTQVLMNKEAPPSLGGCSVWDGQGCDCGGVGVFLCMYVDIKVTIEILWYICWKRRKDSEEKNERLKRKLVCAFLIFKLYFVDKMVEIYFLNDFYCKGWSNKIEMKPIFVSFISGIILWIKKLKFKCQPPLLYH